MQQGTQQAVANLRAQLQRTLFRAADRGWPSDRLEAIVFGVALVALATVLQPLRVGADLSLDAIWAEDSSVFFQGASSLGFFDAVTTPYAEYLVVVPRLIGELGTLVPLADAPAAIALSASAVAGLSGLAIWYASAAQIPSPWLRGVLVVAIVLSPVASLEAIAAGSYSIWYMLPACFWLLIWRPGATWSAALGGLFLLATGLSTPAVWFFFPLAALRALCFRDRLDALLLGGYTLGAAIQVPVVTSSTEGTVTAIWTNDIWGALAQRVFEAGALGEDIGGDAWRSLGTPFLVASLVVLAAAFLALALRASPPARWLAAIALATAVGMFIASAYNRAVGTAMLWPQDISFGLGGRYAIVPVALLLSAALVLVSQPRGGGAPGRGRIVATVAVAALALFAVATSFDVSDEAVRGKPSWSEALDTAAAECEGQQLELAAVAAQPPGWGVTLPCGEIVGAAR